MSIAELPLPQPGTILSGPFWSGPVRVLRASLNGVALVRGGLLELIREELRGPAPAGDGKGPEAEPEPVGGDGMAEGPGGAAGVERPGGTSVAIPAPVKRYTRVRLKVGGLKVAKTSNLQPYLFKVLQEQDAAELTLTIDLSSGAGIGSDVLEQRIVEGFAQLGIAVTWGRG